MTQLIDRKNRAIVIHWFAAAKPKFSQLITEKGLLKSIKIETFASWSFRERERRTEFQRKRDNSIIKAEMKTTAWLIVHPTRRCVHIGTSPCSNNSHWSARCLDPWRKDGGLAWTSWNNYALSTGDGDDNRAIFSILPYCWVQTTTSITPSHSWNSPHPSIHVGILIGHVVLSHHMLKSVWRFEKENRLVDLQSPPLEVYFRRRRSHPDINTIRGRIRNRISQILIRRSIKKALNARFLSRIWWVRGKTGVLVVGMWEEERKE